MNITKTLIGLTFFALSSGALLAQDNGTKSNAENTRFGGSFAEVFCDSNNSGVWNCFLFYSGDLQDTYWSVNNGSIINASKEDANGTCSSGTFVSVTADTLFSDGSTQTSSAGFSCN